MCTYISNPLSACGTYNTALLDSGMSYRDMPLAISFCGVTARAQQRANRRAALVRTDKVTE